MQIHEQAQGISEGLSQRTLNGEGKWARIPVGSQVDRSILNEDYWD